MRFVYPRLFAAASAAFLSFSLCGFGLTSAPAFATGTTAPKSNDAEHAKKHFGSSSGSGLLAVMTPQGSQRGVCPLKHTDVKADISGYVARVTVKQVFENPFKDKIEAVYTFPLADSAAVDEMEMKVGRRTIRGTIKKREDARQIYDTARQAGQVASLLDQERTNIFTQSVANIEPGAKVEITLKYVDLLPYEAGNYTFAFPTVVGPRFMPGTPTGHSGVGRVHDTNMVPDASRISPPVASERSGTDIAIDVHINEGGIPIAGIACKLHDVEITNASLNAADVKLRGKSTIPNKDFVLTWGVAGDKLQSGYLTHRDKDAKSGYFTMMVLPPRRVEPSEIAPKEMIFLIDCSGSQSGPPLQKAKEAMLYILDHMNDNDTFQVISFSDRVKLSSARPEKATGDMRRRAKRFINALQADGGTWMAPAVEKACSIPADANRLRIVTFMTDGYVGNDYEVLGLVRKLRGKSRWFPFGTGDSVNRTLIDGIASEGGGEPEYVLLNTSANAVGKRFYDRISSPVLTDVKLDFHDLAVKEVFPHAISDVWAERPLYIAGRYTKAGAGTVTVSGFSGGKPWKKDIKVVFPEHQSANDVLGPIWARKKVDRLMSEDWFGAQTGQPHPEIKDEIVRVALDHHIMTQYTSFGAVEEKNTTRGGPARTVPVQVEQPEGVSRETTLGQPPMPTSRLASTVASLPAPPLPASFGYGKPVPSPAPKSGYYGGGGGAPGVAYGARVPGASALHVHGTLQKARFYRAPNEIQIVDERPIVTDFREAPSAPAGIVLPPPPATPVAVAASVGGGGGISASARRTQNVVALKPDADSKDAEESGVDKKSQAASNDHSKLHQKLNQLLLSLNKNPQGISEVRVVNGNVLVKINLTSTDKKVLDALKALGVRITITDKTFIIAEVPVTKLLELTQVPEVKLIEPAK